MERPTEPFDPLPEPPKSNPSAFLTVPPKVSDGPTYSQTQPLPSGTADVPLPVAPPTWETPVTPSVSEGPGRVAAPRMPTAAQTPRSARGDSAPAPRNAFSHERFHLTAGVPAGETAAVRDDQGNTLLTYRGFASVIGIVAALMSAIVVVAGLAAVLFLAAEGRPLPAVLALALSVGFAFAIAAIIPKVTVTLFEHNTPVLTIVQRTRSRATYEIRGADGSVIAWIRKGRFSRLAKNRWRIHSALDPHQHGIAVEESFGRALVRKVLGKFSRKFEANIRIEYVGADVGWIFRRAEPEGEIDVLDLTLDRTALLDRRIAVALAVVILGSEP